MRSLNGWKRIWVVVTVLWMAPTLLYGAMMVTQNRPYEVPELTQWKMRCDASVVREDSRHWVQREDGTIPSIDVWIPTGHTLYKNCGYFTPLTLVRTPNTNSYQLPVFASLDNDLFNDGHDLDSATAYLISHNAGKREARLNEALFKFALSFSVPFLLLGCGYVVAWIRRGFGQAR